MLPIAFVLPAVDVPIGSEFVRRYKKEGREKQSIIKISGLSFVVSNVWLASLLQAS